MKWWVNVKSRSHEKSLEGSRKWSMRSTVTLCALTAWFMLSFVPFAQADAPPFPQQCPLITDEEHCYQSVNCLWCYVGKGGKCLGKDRVIRTWHPERELFIYKNLPFCTLAILTADFVQLIFCSPTQQRSLPRVIIWTERLCRIFAKTPGAKNASTWFFNFSSAEFCYFFLTYFCSGTSCLFPECGSEPGSSTGNPSADICRKQTLNCYTCDAGGHCTAKKKKGVKLSGKIFENKGDFSNIL